MTTATTRTVASHRPGGYIINHRQQDDPRDRLHRTDGPAHIAAYPNGTTDPLITLWFDDGLQHRFDGPASTTSDGDIFWHVNDNPIARLPEPPSRDRS